VPKFLCRFNATSPFAGHWDEEHISSPISPSRLPVLREDPNSGLVRVPTELSPRALSNSVKAYARVSSLPPVAQRRNGGPPSGSGLRSPPPFPIPPPALCRKVWILGLLSLRKATALWVPPPPFPHPAPCPPPESLDFGTALVKEGNSIIDWH